MSFRCYYVPPEPSFLGFTDSAYYQPERVPEWTPEPIPPIEYEAWPPRDYPEYMGNMYRPDTEDDMWLEPEPPQRPRLQIVEGGYKRPWPGRKIAPKSAAPKDAVSDTEPAYTRVADIDAHTARQATVRVAHNMTRLLRWVTINGTAGIEDLIGQILYSVEMIKKKMDYDSAQLKAKMKAKQKHSQLKLVT